ncbi:MAG: hypothetical protein IPM25_19715 [Chloracidobacterium sp.]|nr:hypothetical protein [Chloracidobacterium sp.]
MIRIKWKLQLCASIFSISVLGLGGIVLTGCTANEAKRAESSQTIDQKSALNQVPTATPTYLPIGPPPAPPRKPKNYPEMHRSITLLLRNDIHEREKEIGLQPIEDLPDSESEIRLWYFPAHDSNEKLRGIIFSTSSDGKPLLLVNKTSTEEVYLDQAKRQDLMRIIKQSNLEKLNDTETIEVIPSPGNRYFAFQIRSGPRVSFKTFPAVVGSNVKQTGPNDLCDAANLCRTISELLSLNFSDCKCSLANIDR